VYSNGKHKASFDAFRMPLYLPVTSTRRGRKLEVWGDIRPAHFVADSASAPHAGSPPAAQIQFQRGSRGGFRTVQTVTITNSEGYFDVRVAFPASGSVRIAWTTPGGAPIYSRTQTIRVR
jgi:hypothetical protein